MITKKRAAIFLTVFVGCLIAQQITTNNIQPGAKRGNGKLIQLSTGSVTTNNLAKFDGSGNIVDAGTANGPSGPTGATGSAGSIGSTGATGPSGATGASGPSGPSGTSSFTAGTGITISGSTISTNNTIIPQYDYSGSLPGTCVAGRDFHTDTVTGDLFNCGATNTWRRTKMPLSLNATDSGGLTLTTSFQDVPGLSITMPAGLNISYGITATFSVVAENASVDDIGQRIVVIFTFNGVDDTTHQAHYLIPAENAASTITMVVPVLSGAGQIVKVRARKVGGTGSSSISRGSITVIFNN